MSAYDDLSPRRRAFVDHYVSTGNASEAARLAGYATKANVQGPRLLANASIQAAIRERAAPLASARIMSAEGVLELLSDLARDKDVDTRARVKALELLGKRYALWVERHEIQGGGGVLILPKIATHDEWEKLWGRWTRATSKPS